MSYGLNDTAVFEVYAATQVASNRKQTQAGGTMNTGPAMYATMRNKHGTTRAHCTWAWTRIGLGLSPATTAGGRCGTDHRRCGEMISDSRRAYRVLETSHPPVYYVPPEDIRMEHLALAAEGVSFCEWKGVARYYDLETEERKEPRAAWFYPDPVPAYAGLKDYVAFYPSSVDACWVDGEKVRAQEGDFYGGWITSDIVGPFKGGPGTWGW